MKIKHSYLENLIRETLSELKIVKFTQNDMERIVELSCLKSSNEL